MNTVFKLGYQAWLLLAIAGVGALASGAGVAGRARAGLPFAWAAVAARAASRSSPSTRSPARTRARTASRTSPTLDGLGWLRDGAPGDAPAIDWLRDHAPRGSVVLESVGDDYSAFGHARISTFTGLPTVLGWTGHELQWGHDAGSRRADVDRPLQDARRGGRARRCSSSYGVRYVVVGPLERADHGDAGLAKWDRARRAASSTATGRRCGSCRLIGSCERARRARRPAEPGRSAAATAAHVEPLGHAAGGVPGLALGEPAPPRGRA